MTSIRKNRLDRKGDVPVKIRSDSVDTDAISARKRSMTPNNHNRLPRSTSYVMTPERPSAGSPQNVSPDVRGSPHFCPSPIRGHSAQRDVTPQKAPYSDRMEDEMSNDRFANTLMEIEERFNREMEHSRRRDLEKKHDLRERQLEARIRTLEEMQAASDSKATALVRLMKERERQLEEHFGQQLERLRRGPKAVRMDDDRQEQMQLRATIKNLREENEQLTDEVQSLRSQLGATTSKPPLFGLELDDRMPDNAGVTIATVAGPAAFAGLKPRDVIQQLTITLPIRSRNDFHHAMTKVESGDRVNFVLVRGTGEKEVVPVVAGGTARSALRSLENLSHGTTAMDSVSRPATVRDDGAARLYGRRMVEDKPSDARPHYPPLPRPPTSDSIRHIALDGSMSYVPMSEALHTPGTPAPAAPSMSTRSPYIAAPHVMTHGAGVPNSPMRWRLPLSPAKGAPAYLSTPDRSTEHVEEFRCE